MGNIFVRRDSHRAREKLVRQIAYRHDRYCDRDRPSSGGYFPIPDDARKVPGVSRAIRPEALTKCRPSEEAVRVDPFFHN